MTIRNVSLLPLDVCCAEQVRHGLENCLRCGLKRRRAMLLAGASCLAWAGAVSADAVAPPDGVEWIYNEAQWGPPDAPFVFSGTGLYTAGTFESGRQVLIGDSLASIHVQGGTSLHLSGAISSQGAAASGLEKLGAGTLALSGPNSYRGNTMLREGTLRVMGEDALGSKLNSLLVDQGSVVDYAPGAAIFNQMHLRGDNSADGAPGDAPAEPASRELADSVQWRVDSGVAIQAGNVIGSVPVVKQGGGTLRLAGIAGSPFFVTVNQGALAVDWHLAGAVRVNRAARLEGGGTVRSATIMDGGVLSPGNGAGDAAVFTVTEKLEFRPGAIFEVDATALGQADFVQVAGKALLDGHVVTRAGAGDWRPSTRYTLLYALDGFDGTRFASAATDLPFLTPTLSYGEQAVYMSLDRNGTPLDEVAETPTEDGVADAVDDNGSPGVRDEIVAMNPEQAREAFRQLSGSWAASLRSGMLEDSRFLREAVMRNVGRAGGAPAGELSAHSHPDTGRQGPRFWSQAFHSSADRAADGGTPADRRDIGGLALGIERPVGADWWAGGFFGAQRSHQWRRQSMAGARIDSAHAGLSLAGRWRDVDLAVGLARTWHEIRSHREIGVAGLYDALSADYRGRTLQAFGEAAAPLRWLGKALARRGAWASSTAASSMAPTISPFARLAWVRTGTAGFVEKGAAAALRVAPESQAVWFATLGLRAAHTIETPTGIAQVGGELAWRHASGDVRAFSRQRFRDGARQTLFESEGLGLARRAWSLQLGVRASLGRNASLGMGYAGQFAAGRRDHGFRMATAWAF